MSANRKRKTELDTPKNEQSPSKIPKKTYDYDFIVIGGGSGGMAAAKEAARHGARVALFDFVKPSPQGTTWGLGGTCVNVGCVPKKLMHYAGLLGAGFHDAHHFGWNTGETTHDWSKLVEEVQNHVRSLNFGYRTGLRSNKVKYIKALASFVDAHTVGYTFKGKEEKATADKFLIAVGGRPYIPDVEGARELALTSDDIFSHDKDPGKVLCVGGAYISLETAGFLHELGHDVTVAVRSILLRGFDRQCSEKVGSTMEQVGVKLKYGWLPQKIQKTEDGRLEVQFKHKEEKESQTEVFDTVLYATGRRADTGGLNLDAVGIEVNSNGKIKCQNEQTNVENIYAVGDVLEGRPELTPVAIQAGEYLARRLYAGSKEQMNYDLVATTVFTPFEYGCVGLSEEDAIEKYGADNIETYLFEFSNLELGASHRKGVDGWELPPMCLSKLVCLKNENERVVGFHFVGPNAGEVTQGFALSLHLGATKAHFDKIVGIHPTDAEAFTSMDITRSSGEEFVASGGCGGGKCG